jgi:hypothetical protein
MTDQKGTHRGRVFVAMSDGDASEQMLALGAKLAAGQTGELVALMRDDPMFLTLGDLPFVREVDRATGVLREFDRAHAEHTFCVLTRRYERCLAELATAHKLATVLRVVSGKILETALNEILAADVLFVGQINRYHPGARWIARIGVVTNDTPADEMALQVAAVLDGTQHTGLHLLLPVASAVAREISQAVGQKLAAAGPLRVASYAPTSTRLDNILSTAHEMKLNVLVLSRRYLQDDVSTLREYLTRSEFCVVLTP